MSKELISSLAESMNLSNVWVLEDEELEIDIKDITSLINRASYDPVAVIAEAERLRAKIGLCHLELSHAFDQVKAAKSDFVAETKVEIKSKEAEYKKKYGRVTNELMDSLVQGQDRYKALQSMEIDYRRAKEVVYLVKEMLDSMCEVIRYMMRHHGSMPATGTPVEEVEAAAIIKEFETQVGKINQGIAFKS